MGIFDKLKRKKTEAEATKDVAKADVPAKKGAKKEDVKPEVKQNSPKDAKPAAVTGKIEFFHDVLVKPLITEKTLAMQAQNKYTFFVNKDASKHKIKMAVKEIYGVLPSSVNVIKKQPTTLQRWGRFKGIKKGAKKAIITMPKGTSLQIIE